MIIKYISHGSMKKSIDYLYNKVNNEDAKFYEPLSYHRTSDSFISAAKDIIENNDREVTLNSNLKHAVLSFHPNDSAKLNTELDSIVKDFLDKVGLDESHNVTAFVHNDRMHPHVHLIWTRISNEQNIWNDQKIGWRFKDIAKELNQEYKLTKPRETKITFHSNEMYNPTDRGELKKTLLTAAKYSSNKKEWESLVKNAGVFIHDKNGERLYITKNRKVISENTLPKYLRVNNIDQTIKQNKPTKDELINIEDIKNVLSECGTLQEIKESFPDSKITYQQQNQIIYNLQIEIEGKIYTMNDCNISNIHIPSEDILIKNDSIFEVKPIIHGLKHPEQEENNKAAKKKRRARELGLKVKLK